MYLKFFEAYYRSVSKKKMELAEQFAFSLQEKKYLPWKKAAVWEPKPGKGINI